MQTTPSLNLLAAMAAQLRPHTCFPASQVDVSGVWQCDDGGMYFVRQIGPDIMWYGEGPSERPFFANVAHGRIDEDGAIRLMWADVPKGITGACGGLVLHVPDDAREMRAIQSTGGFGGRTWSR